MSNSHFTGNTLNLELSVAQKQWNVRSFAMGYFRRNAWVLTCKNTPRTASPSGAWAASTKLGYLSEFQWTTWS